MRIAIVAASLLIAACTTPGQGMGGARSYYELVKEKNDGLVREYAVTSDEARSIVIDALAQAGWSPEPHKDGTISARVKDNLAGAGHALIWVDPKETHSVITVRSGTALVMYGDHPLSEQNVQNRISGVVQSFVAKRNLQQLQSK